MRSTNSRLSRSVLASAATVALLAALTACGSPAASPDGTSGASSGGSATASESDFDSQRDAYDLKMAQCLRDAGLDVKDPQPGQGIQESSPEIDAAVPACMDEVGAPPVRGDGDKPSDAEMLAIWLKEADCFRERGFDVEEPTLELTYTIPENATEEDIEACLQP